MTKNDKSINAQSTFECCGCSVCKLACPIEECISLPLNLDGYIEAIANEETCINCGACQKVCYKYQDVFAHPFGENEATYTAIHKDDTIRFHSSSGGVGSALCSAALELGYVVVGAEFDFTSQKVRHVFIEKEGDISRIRGSKYLPSFTYEAFEKIEKNKKYLVIATPCQIGGLRKYFGDSAAWGDVLLVDFRCFGHPGYNLFARYSEHLKNDVNPSGIKKINMRSKAINWHQWGVAVEFADGKKYFKDKFDDLFAAGFRTGQAVHDVCLSCDMYKNATHADIRIEDAWAFVEAQSGDRRKNGLSQVGIFSEKGERFFEAAKKYLECEKVAFDYASAHFTKVKREPFFMESLRDSGKKLDEILALYWAKHPDRKRTWVWQYLTTQRYYKDYIRHFPKPLKEGFISLAVLWRMDMRRILRKVFR